MTALTDELAAHETDSAVRIRLTQALVELPGTTAATALRDLTRDADRTVALIASAFVAMLERRSPTPDKEPDPPSPS